MKLCHTDTRNPEKWSKADRQRDCSRAMVSSRWTRNPFGVRPVEVMPMVQPGILYFDEKPADATGYNALLRTRLEAIPEWDKVAGGYLPIWASNDGRQQLWAFDVSNVAVVEAWATTLAESFPWAHGIHFDYFSSLGWLAPDRPVWAWRGWDTGYALLTRRVGYMHNKTYKLIGQQYHRTAITHYVDGLYHEESPGHFGQSFEDLARIVGPQDVIELRSPENFPESYREQVKAFVEERGCYLSWGRDATAGVGL